MEVLETKGINGGSLKLVQVPHHGSRRNVGPTVLNRLLGATTATEGERRGQAIVSAPRTNPKHKHPSKKVVNAFHRRGYPVSSTQDGGKCYRSANAPQRDGWSTAETLPFFDQVEADGDDE